MASPFGRRALVLTALAFLWSVGVFVAGWATLVDQNGERVLWVLAVPAVVTLVVWVALWRRCSRGGRPSGYLAWAAVAALALFCLLAILSIGIFVAPVAVLLGFAVSLTPSGSARTPVAS
jgi:hypothetical protein